jgi:hypothetical protein
VTAIGDRQDLRRHCTACSSAGDPVDVVTFGLSRAMSPVLSLPTTEPRLKCVTGPLVVLKPVASGDFAVCRMIPNINQKSAVAGDQIQVMFLGPIVVEP